MALKENRSQVRTPRLTKGLKVGKELYEGVSGVRGLWNGRKNETGPPK